MAEGKRRGGVIPERVGEGKRGFLHPAELQVGGITIFSTSVLMRDHRKRFWGLTVVEATEGRSQTCQIRIYSPSTAAMFSPLVLKKSPHIKLSVSNTGRVSGQEGGGLRMRIVSPSTTNCKILKEKKSKEKKMVFASYSGEKKSFLLAFVKHCIVPRISLKSPGAVSMSAAFSIFLPAAPAPLFLSAPMF